MVLLNELNSTNFSFDQVLIILLFLMFVQYFSACIGQVTNLAKGVLNIFCSIILWKTLERQTGLFFDSREATAAIIGNMCFLNSSPSMNFKT